MKKPTKAERIATLERKNRELEAQLAHIPHFARIGLEKVRGIKGGAVIVTMHHLGGKEVCPAFAIKDGPSDVTIDALVADLRRTHESITELKP